MCVFVFASGHVICEGGKEREGQCVSESVLDLCLCVCVCVCASACCVLREKVETLISWHKMSGRKDG